MYQIHLTNKKVITAEDYRPGDFWIHYGKTGVLENVINADQVEKVIKTPQPKILSLEDLRAEAKKLSEKVKSACDTYEGNFHVENGELKKLCSSCTKLEVRNKELEARNKELQRTLTQVHYFLAVIAVAAILYAEHIKLF